MKKTVAILVADGFEQSELESPRKALEQAGYETEIVSPNRGKVRSWSNKDWGDTFNVDIHLDRAEPQDYDALMLPGGVMSPDILRNNQRAVEFVKSFVEAEKPIGAICHAPWTLINAQGIKNKELTSYPSIRVDLINAGGRWMDSEVVVDGNLVTSRSPEDLPAFNREFCQKVARPERPMEL